MKVSVLINNYNYGRFLKECILSIRNQTYKDVEIILYDDGSSDNSVEIAKQFSEVKIISNPNFGCKPSQNQAKAINDAFKISTGEIICLLDSDDYFALDKIEKVVKVFKNNDKAVLVQNAALIVSENKKSYVVDFSSKVLDYKELFYSKKWTGYFNPTSCLSFKKDYLEKILPIEIDEFWRVWPDVRLSRIAPFYGDVLSIEERLTFYRKHSKNDSSISNRNGYNTLKNQIAHHEYLNKSLNKLNEKKIRYKLSFRYLKYLIKSVIT